jgi:hypothetical protein
MLSVFSQPSSSLCGLILRWLKTEKNFDGALNNGVDLHCYKTFRRIPPPSPDDAGLILLGRGKRLLYMGREFAPSGTEVFRNHRKFPAIFTLKKGDAAWWDRTQFLWILILSSTTRPRFFIFLDIYSNKYKIKRLLINNGRESIKSKRNQ